MKDFAVLAIIAAIIASPILIIPIIVTAAVYAIKENDGGI